MPGSVGSRIGARLAHAAVIEPAGKVSLFTLFTAALDALLYRYTGQEDILLGIPLADRDRSELQSMIGFLLHTHVLRTQASRGSAFPGVAGAGAKVAYSTLHATAPRLSTRWWAGSSPSAILSYSPLFQVMINWRDRDQLLSFIGMEGLEVESLLAESSNIEVRPDPDAHRTTRTKSSWRWNIARICLTKRDRTHGGPLPDTAGKRGTDPEQRLADLPLLTGAERRQLLMEWSPGADRLPGR